MWFPLLACLLQDWQSACCQIGMQIFMYVAMTTAGRHQFIYYLAVYVARGDLRNTECNACQ